MFACYLLNWSYTQNRALLRREPIYSYSLNVCRKIKEIKQWENERKKRKLHMRKMSKAIEENKLKVMIKDFYVNSIWNLCIQTKIMI